MPFAAGRYLFGRSAGYHLSAAASAFGTHVDNVVGRLDNVHVVLDNDHRIAFVHKALQHAEQHAYVLEVQPRGGFV